MSITLGQESAQEVVPTAAQRQQNRIAQRIERERAMVQSVMSKSRAELEAACLAAGAQVAGLSDEALRSTLFSLHRGGPVPPVKML